MSAATTFRAGSRPRRAPTTQTTEQSTFQPDHSIGGGMVSSMKRGMKSRRRRWDEDTRVRILFGLALSMFVLLSGYWLIRINSRIPLALYMKGVWNRINSAMPGKPEERPERLVEL